MVGYRQLSFLGLALVLLALSGCGGGSGGSGGGGKGPTIATLSPTNMMVGVPLGSLLVSGSNFNADALVAIDGQPVSTDLIDPHTLQAEIYPSFDNTVATHQITVQESAGTSKPVSISVYAPEQGPFVMNAIPGVGSGPQIITSAPMEQMPAAIACSNM